MSKKVFLIAPNPVVPVEETRCGGSYTAQQFNRSGHPTKYPTKPPHPTTNSFVSSSQGLRAPHGAGGGNIVIQTEPTLPSYISPSRHNPYHAEVTRVLAMRRQIRQAKDSYLSGLQRQPNSARAQAKKDAFFAVFGEDHNNAENQQLVENTLADPKVASTSPSGSEPCEPETWKYNPEMRPGIVHTNMSGIALDVHIAERVAFLESSKAADPTTPHHERVGVCLTLLDTLRECTTGLLKKCLGVIKTEIYSAIYDTNPNETDSGIALHATLVHRLKVDLQESRKELKETQARVYLLQQQLNDQMRSKGPLQSAASDRDKATDVTSDYRASVQNKHLHTQLEEVRGLLRQSNERLFEFAKKKGDMSGKFVDVIKESHDELLLLLTSRDVHGEAMMNTNTSKDVS
eukprot:PhF_6_TR6171/c0_g1_i1/m.9213